MLAYGHLKNNVYSYLSLFQHTTIWTFEIIQSFAFANNLLRSFTGSSSTTTAAFKQKYTLTVHLMDGSKCIMDYLQGSQNIIYLLVCISGL